MALEVPYRSIPDMFRQRVAATPDREALGYPTPDEGIAWLTWAGADRRGAALAARLNRPGDRPRERGALLRRTPGRGGLARVCVAFCRHATTRAPPPTHPAG